MQKKDILNILTNKNAHLVRFYLVLYMLIKAFFTKIHLFVAFFKKFVSKNDLYKKFNKLLFAIKIIA